MFFSILVVTGALEVTELDANNLLIQWIRGTILMINQMASYVFYRVKYHEYLPSINNVNYGDGICS